MYSDVFRGYISVTGHVWKVFQNDILKYSIALIAFSMKSKWANKVTTVVNDFCWAFIIQYVGHVFNIINNFFVTVFCPNDSFVSNIINIWGVVWLKKWGILKWAGSSCSCLLWFHFFSFCILTICAQLKII